MRNTTKAIAALTAIAATMAFGVSQASALTWSQTPVGGSAAAVGELTFTRDGQSYTSTCQVMLGLQLTNNPSGATWSLPGSWDLPCQDSRGYSTQMTIDKWQVGATALVGGSPVMTMKPGSSSLTPSPFWGNIYYTNLNPGTITLDVVNGNATTKTKIVFNNDRVGNMASGGGGLYATGQLELFNGSNGSLITLN